MEVMEMRMAMEVTEMMEMVMEVMETTEMVWK